MKKNTANAAIRGNIVYVTILAVYAFLLYANTILNNYNIDDNIVVLNSNVQKGMRGIPEILTSRYQEAGQYSYGYRPITKITYAIEATVFGRNPHMSHFINALLYSLTAVLLFFVLNKIFAGYLPFFTFCAALLFTAHPLHTEAVASLKNREELLCFLGSFASMYFILRFHQTRKVSQLLVALLLFILSVLSKQNAVVFIFIIPLTFYFFPFRKESPGQSVSQRKDFSSGNIFPATKQMPCFFAWEPVDYPLLTGLIFFLLGFFLPIKNFSGYSLAFFFLSCFKWNTSFSAALSTLRNRWVVAGMICLLLSYPAGHYVGIKHFYAVAAVFFLIYKYQSSEIFRNNMVYVFKKTVMGFLSAGKIVSFLSAQVRKIKYPAILVFLAAIAAAVVIIIPDMFLSPQKRELHSFENPLFLDNDFLQKMTLAFYSLWVYLKLLVVPHPLLFYYGYKHIPDMGFFNPIVIFSMVIHAGLLLIAVFYHKKYPLLSYGVLYHFCGVFLFSNIPAPVPGIVAERLLFMPSLGFCIALAWVIFRLFKVDPASAKIPPPAKRKIITVLILILIPYSIKTIARNRNWKDEMTLFSHDIRYLKNSISANFLYASQLIFHINPNPVTPAEKQESEKNVTLAMKHFAQVLELDSANVKALANIGTLYFQFYANYPLAVTYLQKAVFFDSLFASAYFNLGLCCEKMGKNEEAVNNYLKSIRCDSSAIKPYSVLASHYFRMGDEAAAFRINQRFMKAHPESDVPYLNAGQYYYANGDESEAVSWFEKAAEKNPANSELCLWLSEYFRRNGNAEKAQYYSILASK